MKIKTSQSITAMLLLAGMAVASVPGTPKASTTSPGTKQKAPAAKTATGNQQKSAAKPVNPVNVTTSALPAAKAQTAKPAPQPSIQKAAIHKPSSHKAKKPAEVGRASWYGKAFHGRQTASGEPFDMYQFTAAHRTLPIGSYAKVTNLRNGKWVIVRINDRGPWVDGRVLDISYGAAQRLDFQDRGVTKVKIEVMKSELIAENEVSLAVE